MTGFRLIARRTNGTVRLYSKQGYDHTSRYPQVAEAMSRLKVTSVVLDGEVMCFSPDGQHDFDRLWNPDTRP